MAKVHEIGAYLEKRVPSYTKMDFDNVGLLVGLTETEVTRALVALDMTDEVIKEAIDFSAQLIVSHHPLFFNLKSVVDTDMKGRKIVNLIQNGISAVCLHTSLDAAEGGVNDALLEAVGADFEGLLVETGKLPDGRPYGMSRVGRLRRPMELMDFMQKIKKDLSTAGLRYHDAHLPVSKIGCCGGSGGEDLQAAFAAGCDTYLTADIKYDRFLEAKEMGINLIDGDHFCTENVVVPRIRAMMLDGFPELEVKISEIHRQTVRFI
jgi:dinuclear metal center YbgI/SA1388 family protein